ncbi:unnamed protein product [Ranitomeya imitator]|uniref:Recombination activating protein 1 n=1 Tax=Ranitomeya imitator TaxID=111125 RepID=A0ABN9M8D8_9NEOB|nr:unnamed protein product [Ranitomeya imitator]
MSALRQQAEQEAQASMRQLEVRRDRLQQRHRQKCIQRFQKTHRVMWASQNVNRLQEESGSWLLIASQLGTCGLCLLQTSKNGIDSLEDQKKRQVTGHWTRVSQKNCQLLECAECTKRRHQLVTSMRKMQALPNLEMKKALKKLSFRSLLPSESPPAG